MPEPTRRGRPGHDQATVVRRATALFNAQGYDATSMGDVARELGLTKSALYHHVPGKEHLLAAALDEALAGLGEALDAAVAADGSALDRLRLAVHASVEVLVDHLPAVTLLLRVRGNSPVELAALDRRRELDARVAVLVADAVTEGGLRADLEPDLVARLLLGLVSSLAEWVDPAGALDGPALADAVTTVALDGLLRRPGPG